MHNLIFGFEMLAIGLLIVMTTLLLLALILLGFNKIFYKASNKTQAKVTGNKAVQNGGSGVEMRSRAALEIATTTGETQQTSVRPEIIAASIGALLFARDTQQNSVVAGNNMLGPATNMWAQTGRARALSIRQDFVLLRRGKHR